MFCAKIGYMSSSDHKFHEYDVLILGSGAAGLTTALHLNNDLRIAVISKGELSSGSTAYAQGGISAVLDDSDSIEQHISDTLSAGAGLGDPEVVAKTVSEGKKVIEWLQSIGVESQRPVWAQHRADTAVDVLFTLPMPLATQFKTN